MYSKPRTYDPEYLYRYLDLSLRIERLLRYSESHCVLLPTHGRGSQMLDVRVVWHDHLTVDLIGFVGAVAFAVTSNLVFTYIFSVPS